MGHCYYAEVAGRSFARPCAEAEKALMMEEEAAER